MFPTDSSVIPTPPFPTHGLCRVGISPLSCGTMKELRLLGFLPGPLDSRSRLDTSAGSACSLAAASEPLRLHRDVVKPVASMSGILRRSSRALPSSQGTLLCLCPALRPRSRLRARPSGRLGVVPLIRTRRTLDYVTISRGSITRPQHSLSTLRAALAGDDARLACRRRPAFPAWDFIPVFSGIGTHRVPLECFSHDPIYVIKFPPHSLSLDGAIYTIDYTIGAGPRGGSKVWRTGAKAWTARVGRRLPSIC